MKALHFFFSFLTFRGIDSYINSFHKILQDNIKDKIRAIPIEVLVAIQSSTRGKRQSTLPHLIPVMNSSDSNKVLTEVQ